MVTIDAGSLRVSHRLPRGWSWTLLIAVATALLAAIGLMRAGFGADGLDAAALSAGRFAAMVFFAAIVAGPLSRLFAAQVFRGYGARRRDILRGFCASYALYIVIAMGAAFWAGQGPAPGMAAFAIFSFAMLAVMAGASTRTVGKYLGRSVQHAVLALAAIYFWLCFVVPVLTRIDGPHRPDAYYGFCMLLMIGALLLRFADSYAGYMRAARDDARAAR